MNKTVVPTAIELNSYDVFVNAQNNEIVRLINVIQFNLIFSYQYSLVNTLLNMIHQNLFNLQKIQILFPFVLNYI